MRRCSTHHVAGGTLADLRDATNTGVNTGSGFCRLFGSCQPFDAATLKALYPTHEDYVSKVRAATATNLTDGFIYAREADLTNKAAQDSDVGK